MVRRAHIAYALFIVAVLLGAYVMWPTGTAPDPGPAPPMNNTTPITDTPNATPKPYKITSLPEKLPPGVGENSVSPAVTAEIHSEQLRMKTYNLSYGYTYSSQSDVHRETHDISAESAEFLTRITDDGVTKTRYSTPGDTYIRVQHPNGSVDYLSRGHQAPVSFYTKHEFIRGVVEAGNFSENITGAWYQDEKMVFTRTTTLADPSKLETVAGVQDISAINATLIIDQDGIVRYMTVRLNTSIAGTPATAWYTLQVDDVNQTRVTQPSWTTQATQSTVRVSATHSDKMGALSLSHEGGAPVDAGTTITVTNNATTYEVTVPSKFTDGDVLYIWFRDGQAYAQVNTPPDQQGEALADTYVLTASDNGGDRLFRVTASG